MNEQQRESAAVNNMRKQFTVETDNLAVSSIQDRELVAKLDFQVEGPFWEILNEEKIVLAVTREYEHFALLLGGNGPKAWQAPFMLPHPSGLYYDQVRKELVISSTRTPNQIFHLKMLSDEDIANSDILPENLDIPAGTIFVPYKSQLLPGTLYIHDLVQMKDEVYATITGHNFLAKLKKEGDGNGFGGRPVWMTLEKMPLIRTTYSSIQLLWVKPRKTASIRGFRT